MSPPPRPPGFEGETESETGRVPIEANVLRETHDFRSVGGMALGCLSVLGAFAGFGVAAASLAAIAGITPRDENHAKLLLGALAAKALVATAFLSFCYALGRAAERFLIPYWWLVSSEDRRAAMGVKDTSPPKGLVEAIKEAIGKK